MDKKQVEEYMADEDQNLYGFELTKFQDKVLDVCILEMMDIQVHFEGKGKFKVTTEEELLQDDWLDDVSSFCKEGGKTVQEVLEKCTEAYAQHIDDESGGDEMEDEEEIELDPSLLKDDDDVFVKSPVNSKTQFDFSTEQYESVDKKFNLKKRTNKRNAEAIACLTKDYLMLQTSDPVKLGFTAKPIGDDFMHWEAKFFGYGKDTPLGQDMIKYKKQSGEDYILLDIKFPDEYPLKPLFIRVVRPRFMFHTAHVTVGGSICTEMLTPKGWLCSTSVESVLIQIRMQMVMGKGRLDFSNKAEYTEQEAHSAFNRVAQQHGWL